MHELSMIGVMELNHFSFFHINQGWGKSHLITHADLNRDSWVHVGIISVSYTHLTLPTILLV